MDSKTKYYQARKDYLQAARAYFTGVYCPGRKATYIRTLNYVLECRKNYYTGYKVCKAIPPREGQQFCSVNCEKLLYVEV